MAQYTDGTVFFTQTDHLGSTRLLTGYPTSSISACYDYYPFGEIISCGATGDQSQKFTGYLRDSETNLDDANARYFASSLGRFMSPDPSGLYFADPTDPQTLNLYSYVGNSPLTMVDPTGMDGINDTDELCEIYNECGNLPVIYSTAICGLACAPAAPTLYFPTQPGGCSTITIDGATEPCTGAPPINIGPSGGGGGAAGGSVPSAPTVSGNQPQSPSQQKTPDEWDVYTKCNQQAMAASGPTTDERTVWATIYGAVFGLFTGESTTAVLKGAGGGFVFDQLARSTVYDSHLSTCMAENGYPNFSTSMMGTF
ncbi:MAG: RHS repeat-associated core domain-containing protein [Candidatus Acidiferrales bacterium]